MAYPSAQLKSDLNDQLGKYPVDFFYSVRQSASAHTSDCTGDMDLQFLVESKPNHWFDVAQSPVRTPKQVILVEWRVVMDDERIEKSCQAIEKMLSFGIKVWRWNRTFKQLISIEEPDLPELWNTKVRRSMSEYEYDTVYDIAIQQLQLPKAAILIVDDYWMAHLISGNQTPQPRQVSLSDVAFNRETYFSCERLSNLTPKLNTIIKDICFEHPDVTNKLLQQIQDVSPNTEVIIQYNQLTLGWIMQVDNKKGVICDPSRNFDSKCQITFGWDMIKNINKLVISNSNIELDHLIRLFNKIEKLTYLSLINVPKLDISSLLNVLPQQHITSIQGLVLNDISYNTWQYLSIFSSFSSLKTLSLSLDHNGPLDPQPSPPSEIQPPTEIHLPKLKKLSVTNLPKQTASILLKGAPNLIHLEAIGTNLDSIAENSLMKLLLLYVDNAQINTLNSLCKSAPNMINIHVKNLSTKDSDQCGNAQCLNHTLEKESICWDLVANSLPKLKTIQFEHMTISAEHLERLLLASSHLQNLDFGVLTDIKGELTLEPNTMPILKRIESCNPELIYANLLAASPQINMMYTNKVILFHQGHHPINQLELSESSACNLARFPASICMHFTSISINLGSPDSNLKRLDLLATIVNLRELRITYIPIENSDSEIDTALDEQAIKRLNRLLSIIPKLSKLKHLHLDLDFFPVNNHFKLEKNSLLSINQFTINDCRISPNQLKNFLLAMPNLTQLNSWGTSKSLLRRSLHLGANTLMKLKRIEFSEEDIISSAFYKNIKSAAPHVIINERNDLHKIIKLESLLDAEEAAKAEKSEKIVEVKRAEKIAKAVKASRSDSEELIDANTTNDENAILPAKRIFYPLDGTTMPDVASYRLKIYQASLPNPIFCTPDKAFSLKNTGDLELEMPNNLQRSDRDTYELRINQASHAHQPEIQVPDSCSSPLFMPNTGISLVDSPDAHASGDLESAWGFNNSSSMFHNNFFSDDESNPPIIDPILCFNDDEFITRQQAVSPLPDMFPSQSSMMPTASFLQSSLFYGKQTLCLDNQWQSLASLKPQEIMLNFHLDHPVDVDIRRSTRDDLYEIRSHSSESQYITIDFILQVPMDDASIMSPDYLIFPQEIHQTINYFSNFGVGELQLDPSQPMSGADYYKAIIDQKVGACRHRTTAFQWYMATILNSDIPVRIVNNEVHSFVELYSHGFWHRFDLGGYPSALEIDERNNPENTASSDTDEDEENSPLSSTESDDSDSSIEENFPEMDDVLLSDAPSDLSIASRPSPPPTPNKLTIAQFCKQRITSTQRRRLIQCQSEEDVHALHFALQYHARRSTGQAIFYVNAPEKMVCSTPYILRDMQNHGTFTQGPSGQLYGVLKAAEAKPDRITVLLINYSTFDTSDIIRTNEVLDDIGQSIDTVPIPNNVHIIALININDPNAYQGDDFTSRFDIKEHCPDDASELIPYIPILPFEPPCSDDPIKAMAHIKLYQALDWERRLLGQWMMQEDTMVFQEGALQKAIASGASTWMIDNGLWDNPDFMHFWQEACQLGHIVHANLNTKLPDNFKLIKRTGYDWEKLTAPLQVIRIGQPVVCILNPGKIKDFFGGYHMENGLVIKYHKGFIEQAAGQSLQVILTRFLDENEWAVILDECSTYQVALEIQCLDPITLPTPLLNKPSLNIKYISTTQEEEKKGDDGVLDAQIIRSTDVEATVALLRSQHIGTLDINVSELSSADLLTHLTADFNKKTLKLSFNEVIGILSEKINRRQHVILKGTFSESLADAIAPFLLNPELRQSLMIVSDNTELFSYRAPQQHIVSIEEKRHLLGSSPEAIFSDEHLRIESVTQLQARCRYLQNHPGEDSQKAWEGLYDLQQVLKPLQPLNTSTSQLEAALHTQTRINDVLRSLEYSPFTFLISLFGAGKSTLVLKEFGPPGNTNKVILHKGLDALKAWATDTSPDKLITLFIDEANLIPTQWTQFDGLFRNQPFIIINSQYYPLSLQHKVIFAGNPLNYGDERKLAPFFKSHGNSLVFQPLPTAVLYEKILKPIFMDGYMALEPNRLTSSQIEQICTYLLTIYIFIHNCAHTEACISPRELEDIALSILSCHQQNQAMDILLITQSIAYDLAHLYLPPTKRKEFAEKFPVSTPPPQVPSPFPQVQSIGCKTKLFLMTPSRQQAAQPLHSMLAMRQLRQHPNANEPQRYAGKNGITFEGDSGIGKSQLVTNVLEQHQFEEIKNLSEQTTSGNFFYRIPAGMPLKQKKQRLLHAFDYGYVVVIDEINSSPMMEELLNALLTGKKLCGTPPIIPGFMVIGTQNPFTRGGRIKSSKALASRFKEITLTPYPQEEIRNILQHYQTPEVNINRLLKKTHKLTFRDILRTAKQRLPQHLDNINSSAAASSPMREQPGFFATTRHKRKTLHGEDAAVDDRPQKR